ncbi:unnamed protein product [Phaedon cochleariae]|uniref:DEUBAD domain-containing protein n=1 Tax=Phaedon cochleariae TaxID=80249 RepID=A0A9N9SEK8_PHACE|nr:unnamed protein product [Phaedon cochleariae]
MDNTSSEDSSSDYTTESSDDDGMETAQINGEKLQLPQGLCERQDIFRDIFCTETWNSLSDENRQHLQTLLPNFPENDDEEKTKTLQRLFDFDVFRFNSPLVKFHDDLKAGYFRPDIVRMRGIIRKTEHKEAKYRHKTFREQLKNEVIESQSKLLSQFRNLPPGIEPRQSKRKLNVDYVSHRTKRRYFQIVSSIRSKTDDPGCSSDENYPEGAPLPMSRKQKRHLNSIRNSLNSSKDKFFNSTMIAKLNGFSLDLEKYITPNHNPFYVNDESYRNMIDQHKRRKLENPEDPELNTKGIVLSDIVHRTQLPYNKNLPVIVKHQVENKVVNRKKVKREHVNHRRSPENLYFNKVKALYEQSSNSDSDSDSTIDAVTISSNNKPRSKSRRTPTLKPKVEIKKEIPSPEPIKTTNIVSISTNAKPPVLKTINNISQYGKITPACVEDLDGIDVMTIPIDLDNSEIDILELTNKPELMQDTHANFFSLIRDIICSTNEHRMNMYTLQERLKTWQENPISPLNDWYSFTDNWIGILPSAITFLCGNASEQPDDFVPYMEYKSSLDVYQWIGAGRDSDNLLSSICNFWLEHRSENKSVSPAKDSEIDMDLYTDRSNTPPPPRCPTNWTVRKATPEEIKDFREQERRRYDNPHKAFTYRCNSYESVVGPIKGIYNPAVGNTKARGHTMLSADRPNFVTILSLVRDAAARLPNGEGTRAEICELLKCSQYISATATDNLLQSVVSGALDRMHTQWDPCVKYDPKKKIWIYLHRNRTEEDFERIHQHYQVSGINKSKKSSSKKSPIKPKASKAAEKTVKTEPQPIVETVQESPDPTPTLPPPPLSLQEPPTKVAPKQQTVVPASQNTPVPGLITVAAPSKSTSLLLCNNLPKSQMLDASQAKVVISDEPPPLAVTSSSPSIQQQKEDKEINDAIHAIIQNRVSSPTVKSGKSLVKMLSPSQGKSLIIPTTNPQLIKQIQEQRGTPTKQMSQVVTQQLLQTIAAQQKQILVQKHNDSVENRQEKLKVPVSVQQQILQSIPAQQLQNIKNVTLLRSSSANVNLTPIASVSSQSIGDQSNIVAVAVSKTEDPVGQPGVQIKTHGTLTQAQQQQILQTIKQKILPNSGLLANSQQQIILKQKSGVLQVQKAGAGGQVIGQHKVSLDGTSKSISSQGPVVAKVLTNAAGQVISLESLLNHQKQHGSLAQGTTLRVSGKSGHQNLIHLTGTTKPSNLAQFAVGSQHSVLTLAGQPKLVVASHASTVTSSVTATKPSSRTAGKAQSNAKTAQHLVSAKLLQSLEPQKVVQSKTATKPSGKNTPFSLNVAGTTNTLRMVSTANLNLGHLGGKPILVASGKGGTLQSVQGQNVILQPAGNGASAPSLVLQKGQGQVGANSINIINQPNLVFSQQVKVQQHTQQVMFAAPTKGNPAAAGQQQTIAQGQHLVLGGHPVRLHAGTGFQGTAINIKALQGVKVIPIAQAGAQGKGVQGRQVLARVMNPSLVKTTAPPTNITEKITEVTLQSRGGE